MKHKAPGSSGQGILEKKNSARPKRSKKANNKQPQLPTNNRGSKEQDKSSSKSTKASNDVIGSKPSKDQIPRKCLQIRRTKPSPGVIKTELRLVVYEGDNTQRKTLEIPVLLNAAEELANKLKELENKKSLTHHHPKNCASMSTVERTSTLQTSSMAPRRVSRGVRLVNGKQEINREKIPTKVPVDVESDSTTKETSSQIITVKELHRSKESSDYTYSETSGKSLPQPLPVINKKKSKEPIPSKEILDNYVYPVGRQIEPVVVRPVKVSPFFTMPKPEDDVQTARELRHGDRPSIASQPVVSLAMRTMNTRLEADMKRMEHSWNNPPQETQTRHPEETERWNSHLRGTRTTEPHGLRTQMCVHTFDFLERPQPTQSTTSVDNDEGPEKTIEHLQKVVQCLDHPTVRRHIEKHGEILAGMRKVIRDIEGKLPCCLPNREVKHLLDMMKQKVNEVEQSVGSSTVTVTSSISYTTNVDRDHYRK